MHDGAAIALCAPRPADATCVVAAPTVIWSFPAKDATDVPLNADLLVIMQGFWGGTVVKLDDRELTAADDVPGRYDLGTLQPHTRYTISVDGPLPGVEDPPAISWTFTTGDAAEQDGAHALHVASGHVRALELGDTFACSDVLYATSCFDTGAPSLYTFDAETDADVAMWMVEWVPRNGIGSGRETVPVDCGPQWIGYPDRGDPTGYRVHGVLRDGTVLSSKLVPVPKDGSDAGCSAAGSVAPSWIAPALALVLLRRSGRRAKRARELN